MNDKETKLTILMQGNTKLLHEYGYLVKGNDEAVCFYIDPIGKAYVESYSYSDNNCPIIQLASTYYPAEICTSVEFSDYPGWRVHCCGGGKSIAVALVNDSNDTKTP